MLQTSFEAFTKITYLMGTTKFFMWAMSKTIMLRRPRFLLSKDEAPSRRQC